MRVLRGAYAAASLRDVILVACAAVADATCVVLGDRAAMLSNVVMYVAACRPGSVSRVRRSEES